MSFYDNLERICREKGTTPNAIVVKKLGKSSSVLTYWRNGGNTPTMKIIEELAEVLGVKPSDLLRTEEDKMQEEKSAKAVLFLRILAPAPPSHIILKVVHPISQTLLHPLRRPCYLILAASGTPPALHY